MEAHKNIQAKKQTKTTITQIKQIYYILSHTNYISQETSYEVDLEQC